MAMLLLVIPSLSEDLCEYPTPFVRTLSSHILVRYFLHE